MDREPMQSKAIRAVGYDQMTGTMEIEFTSGHVYRYTGVTPETHQAFVEAESLGQHFHSEIKPRHTGVKI